MASMFPEKKSAEPSGADLASRATGNAHRLRLTASMTKLGHLKKDFCVVDISDSQLKPEAKKALMDLVQNAHLLRDIIYELENIAHGSKEHQDGMKKLIHFDEEIEKINNMVAADKGMKQSEKAKFINALIYISDLAHSRIQLMGQYVNRHDGPF